MKSFTNILWGIVLVIIGIIFGLNALEITNINIFFDGWWTLFIIIPCFIDIFNEKDKTGNLIGLLIGLALLLCCQGYLKFEIFWKLLIPTILVIVGLSFIFKDVFTNKIKNEMKKLSRNNGNSYNATFSGQNLNFSKSEFKGCELNAIFGGIECDLREAIIKEDVVITTTCVFGGIDLYVPSNVNVKVTSTSIFGGIDNKCKNFKDEDNITIYINANCIFGGVDIK